MAERTKMNRPPVPARPAPAFRAAAVWLAAALAAGACGGGSPAADTSSETPSPTEPPAAASGAEPAAEEPASPEAVEEGEPESLSDYLGFDIDDPDAAAAQFTESERRAQELIALCMAQEGFEYIPVDPAAGQGAVQLGNFDADSEEYARENGFGITTWYGTEESDGQEPPPADPNEAVRAAMSESERGAYMEALYGPPASDDEGGVSFDDLDQIFGAGCQGEAYREVQGRLIRMFQMLGPALEDLNERMEADPRVAEATGGWSACMADRGYRYGSQNELFEQVFQEFGERLDAIVGPDWGAADPIEDWTQEEVEEFLAENSEQEIEDFYQQARSEARAGVDQEALAALQQEERDLAVANFECGRDLQDVLDEVWPEYEQGFIEENREELGQVQDG